jgi:hypothetical protein
MIDRSILSSLCKIFCLAYVTNIRIGVYNCKDELKYSYLLLLGGDHLFRMSELIVTDTELAAIAMPARAG